MKYFKYYYLWRNSMLLIQVRWWLKILHNKKCRETGNTWEVRVWVVVYRFFFFSLSHSYYICQIHQNLLFRKTNFKVFCTVKFLLLSHRKAKLFSWRFYNYIIITQTLEATRVCLHFSYPEHYWSAYLTAPYHCKAFWVLTGKDITFSSRKKR